MLKVNPFNSINFKKFQIEFNKNFRLFSTEDSLKSKAPILAASVLGVAAIGVLSYFIYSDLYKNDLSQKQIMTLNHNLPVCLKPNTRDELLDKIGFDMNGLSQILQQKYVGTRTCESFDDREFFLCELKGALQGRDSALLRVKLLSKRMQLPEDVLDAIGEVLNTQRQKKLADAEKEEASPQAIRDAAEIYQNKRDWLNTCRLLMSASYIDNQKWDETNFICSQAKDFNAICKSYVKATVDKELSSLEEAGLLYKNETEGSAYRKIQKAVAELKKADYYQILGRSIKVKENNPRYKKISTFYAKIADMRELILSESVMLQKLMNEPNNANKVKLNYRASCLNEDDFSYLQIILNQLGLITHKPRQKI